MHFGKRNFDGVTPEMPRKRRCTDFAQFGYAHADFAEKFKSCFLPKTLQINRFLCIISREHNIKNLVGRVSESIMQDFRHTCSHFSM